MLLVFPLYWALFAALWSFLYRRWGVLAALLLPAIWVGLEVIKNAPEIGFPWQELGLTQINFLPAAQLAEIGGIRLVSGWVMGANITILLLLEKRRITAVITCAALAVGLVWGAWRLSHLPQPGPEVTVLLVQGNMDPAAKWRESADSSFVIYETLTHSASQTIRPDLVLWPETAIPSYLGHSSGDQSRMRRFAKEIGAPILTGALHYELKKAGGHERYNSAFFFSAGGTPPLRYDKIRLVPFGERVPFQRWFPSLGELNFGQAEFTAGKNCAAFALDDGVKIAPQICFESVFGDLTRGSIVNGARLICNLTNDGWYGNSSGPYQHADLVRFRSIETRCPLVRAANTGISLAVDSAGRVVGRIPYGQRGAKAVTVRAGRTADTFYVKHGELIPQGLALVGLLGMVASIFKRRRKSRL